MVATPFHMCGTSACPSSHNPKRRRYEEQGRLVVFGHSGDRGCGKFHRISDSEFARLVDAARSGWDVVTISGMDRAMLYVLAAWTGFRKGELGSLTPQSFQLDAEPATVAVEACYSKRKRNDTQVLHPEVVRQLRTWLDAKPNVRPTTLLFPVSRKVPGGIERPTATMMQVDLAAARAKWIAEVSGKERKAREESDFLAYQDRQGRFADFHANRHTFISNLTRAGVGPKMAQTLARHSDINLTMRIYTHVADEDRTAAIATLPAPPSFVAESTDPKTH